MRQPLLAATAAEAPGITLAFRAWGSGVAAVADVASGMVDIAVSVFRPGLPRGVLIETMVDEHYILAGRAGHPALVDVSARTWLYYSHIVISAEGATRTEVDDKLAGLGVERRVALAVPSFLLVPDLLRSSEMLALLPSLVLSRDRAAGLATAPPPIAIDGFRIDMAIHERHRADVTVAFVAASIRSISRATRNDAEQIHG